MRSGADYIFSIFQNHNCPPGTFFFFFLVAFFKSSTVSHFSIAISSFDTKQDANRSREHTFLQAAIPPGFLTLRA